LPAIDGTPKKPNCSTCGALKTPETCGTRAAHGRCYYRSQCLACHNDTTIRHRKREPRSYLRSAAKNRARIAGVPFSLAVSDIIIPAACPVLGIPLVPLMGDKKRSDGTPSLDRIVPELGYTSGNVAIISWRANRIKSDATEEELAAILAYVKAARLRTQERP
jgi:hypothetical protein